MEIVNESESCSNRGMAALCIISIVIGLILAYGLEDAAPNPRMIDCYKNSEVYKEVNNHNTLVIWHTDQEYCDYIYWPQISQEKKVEVFTKLGDGTLTVIKGISREVATKEASSRED